jgi:hypothetical protein
MKKKIMKKEIYKMMDKKKKFNSVKKKVNLKKNILN